MCNMIAGARNPENLLTSRIPVLQVPRDNAFDVVNPTTRNIKKNAEPRMPNVMDVVLLVTSRNVARSQATSQKIILIARISLLPQVQEA